MEGAGIDYRYVLDAGIFAVSRAKVFVNSTEFQTCSKETAGIRLEALQDAWEQIKSSEGRVAINNDLLANAEMQRKVASAEADYFIAYAKLQAKLKEQEQRAGGAGGAGPIEVQVTIPFSQENVTNTWGKFDGEITKWQGVRDLFKAAVHENDKIAPAYKFSYLKASLTGRAANTLGEWELSEKNYYEAWKRLDEIYTRKYTVCRELLRNFFKLPELQERAEVRELQRMSNTTHETLRQLAAQGVPTDSWDIIVIHVLHEKLDRATACKWEESRTSEEPTAKEFCDFLEKRAQTLEGGAGVNKREPLQLVQPSTSRAALERAGLQPGASRATTEKMRAQPSTSRAAIARAGSKKMPCHLCKSIDHPLWRCPSFATYSLKGKQDFVREKALCPNCLKTGHTTAGCFYGPCSQCPGGLKHNSILCPINEIRKDERRVFHLQEKGRKRGQEQENKQKSD